MEQMIKGSETSIDVDALTNELEDELKSNDLLMSSNSCIFKVPTILSRHNEKAYYPNGFSIGPFHYSKPLMKATKKIKLKYLRDLISRSNKSLRNFIEAINQIQTKARESYAEPIEIDNEEFIKVLVLDSCFIIEFFCKNFDKKLRDKDDPIFTTSCFLQILSHDLILLENQVPWFVLEILFKMTETNIGVTLAELAILFFSNMVSKEPPLIGPLGNHGSKHILDLLRSWMISSSSPSQGETDWQLMPSATSLKDAGIKFKKCSMERSILDVRFEKGILEMSSLLIHENTEPLFRNLISFEQCCPNVTPVITSYAILMDNLITTKEDMVILCKSKVIDNWLNVEDATKYFNQLYDDTYVKETFYMPLTRDVNRYSQRRWPKYRAVLMRDYFKHPWALISVFVAAFLVICTFLQTLYSIIK